MIEGKKQHKKDMCDPLSGHKWIAFFIFRFLKSAVSLLSDQTLALNVLSRMKLGM